MKTLKTKQLFIFFTMAMAVFYFGSAMAQQAQLAGSKAKINKAVVQQNPGVAAVMVQLKTDLEVRHISASQCFCNDSLSKVGAMLYRDIWVTLGNYNCSDGKGAGNVKAFLDVQYFDLMANRMVSTTIPLTLDKNRTREVKVRTGFVLIKQNQGIKATMRMGTNTPSVVDCNTTNNRKIEKKCQLPLVY